MQTRVQNGARFESAQLEWKSETVVVPDTWNVKRSTTNGNIQLKVKKELNYYGFPEQRVTIENVSSEMGVALKRENKDLYLRDFGGYSTQSGGAKVSVEIAVPMSCKVKVKEVDVPKLSLVD